MGRSELHAAVSHAERALEHLLKLAAWPDDPAADVAALDRRLRASSP